MLAFFMSVLDNICILLQSLIGELKKHTKELKNVIDKTYFVFTLQISMNVIIVIFLYILIKKYTLCIKYCQKIIFT